MQNKRIKIIYFSMRDSKSKQIELSSSKFYSFLFTTFIGLLVLVAVSIALVTDFYQNLEIASLSKFNKFLETQIFDMGNKLTQFETQIKELENEDDDLRLIAALPKIDSDTRDVGMGGFLEINYNLSIASNEIEEQVYEYQHLLDQLERRIELTKLSREEIKERLDENQKLFKHTPSIRPLIGGRIRDKFGFRLHPLTERIQHHDGIDIAAEKGTEVFATAAGVVEKVVTKYMLNRGYGKQVLINHGFGFKTRYGHLEKILVRKGQKVDRFTPLGLVGDTGLATGPHLHYEVIQEGKKRDPLGYIMN
ncbi:MAG: peptidoglycan DD-metalloendopeptidase family protein [bacterium]